jgi:hypothetical protein
VRDPFADCLQIIGNRCHTLELARKFVTRDERKGL